MTIQSELLLKKLRKAEQYEGQPLFIDFEARTISNVCEASEPQINVPYPGFEDATISTLRYLEADGKIKIGWCNSDDGALFSGYVFLTHEGSHIWQIRLTWLCRNIFLPVIVSALTTLVTLMITRTV